MCVFFEKGDILNELAAFVDCLFIRSTATAEGRKQVTHGLCLRGRTDCNNELGTKSLLYYL